MRGLLALMLAVLAAAPGWAATAHVGKLDGAAGPTLKGVATPGFGGSEAVESAWVVDWDYVAQLVQAGDWQTALATYQDIKWRSEGADKLRAMEGVAAMQEQLGQTEAALTSYRELLSALPADSAKRSEMMAKALMLSDAPAQRVLARQLVPAMVEGDKWAAWGIEQAVRAEAKATLQVRETYGLPSAEALQQALGEWRDRSERRAATAARLAMLPGAGLLYLGDWRAGLGTLAVFLFLLVMVVGTSNRQQWGIAVWWWLILAAVMLNTPQLAAERAAVMAEDEVMRILS